ncbi:hypothetical protein [Streptomyces sp. NPDC057909]|uniref:hypothetical protein n=1 Tax=Streptomyces sp. NPDC057909 TaxID=3346277 RepID=UPI0036E6001B
MARLGPLVTLAAGVLLAGGIAVANTTGGSPPPAHKTAAGAVSASDTATASSVGEAGAKAPEASSSLASAAPSPAPSSAAATAGASVSAPMDYAGRVVSGRVALAVSVQDGRAVGYLCDGKWVEAWLYGAAGPDGKLNLTGKNGSALRGTRAHGHATGTVTTGGHSWTFDLPKTEKPGAIYRATGQAAGKKLRAGWILLPDGTQTGVVERGNTPAPAPLLDPTTGQTTIDGTPLTAAPLTSSSNPDE